MFVLVNFILIMVLSIVDKILGWERAGGEGVLTTIYGCWFAAILGGAVSSAARYRSFGLVATAAVDPDRGLAGDSDLQLPERHAG
jgi:hypothetical protein